MADLIVWGFWVTLFIVSYFVGTCKEKAHLKNIVQREKALISLPALSMKCPEELPVSRVELVYGNVVIGGDFFKQIVANLASVFGMRISVAEAMMDRARREAVLRMKEKAIGADAILNVRIEGFKIGERKKITGIEAMACGTAIYYAK